MTEPAFCGVSRRGFLLTLAAACLVGVRECASKRALDDACVRCVAVWAG
ncbi:MAG: hypothetical protein WCK89_01180 [bacterium]